MGANLKEVRERIKSVVSTQQITKAMKMVSAAKLRRAQQAIVQLRPYSEKLNGMLTNILSNISGDDSSVFNAEREAKSIAFAIASRHKKEGMPSNASARFSSTGKRTGFIEAALDGIEPKLAALIEQGIEETINFVIESFFKTQIGR